jgi:hypothetical protein
MPGAAARQTQPPRRIPGEEGIWVFVLGDMSVFALFFATFMYSRGKNPHAFNQDHHSLSVALGTTNTVLLLSSSLFVALPDIVGRLGFEARQRVHKVLAHRLVRRGTIAVGECGDNRTVLLEHLLRPFRRVLGVQPRDAKLDMQIGAIPCQIGVLADFEDRDVKVVGQLQQTIVGIPTVRVAGLKNLIHLRDLAFKIGDLGGGRNSSGTLSGGTFQSFTDFVDQPNIIHRDLTNERAAVTPELD